MVLPRTCFYITCRIPEGKITRNKNQRVDLLTMYWVPLFSVGPPPHSSSGTVGSLGSAVWLTMATIATDMFVRITYALAMPRNSITVTRCLLPKHPASQRHATVSWGMNRRVRQGRSSSCEKEMEGCSERVFDIE